MLLFAKRDEWLEFILIKEAELIDQSSSAPPFPNLAKIPFHILKCVGQQSGDPSREQIERKKQITQTTTSLASRFLLLLLSFSSPWTKQESREFRLRPE